MPINRNEITKEMIAIAIQCGNSEDLMALAKEEGVGLTKKRSRSLFGRTV